MKNAGVNAHKIYRSYVFVSLLKENHKRAKL